MLIERLVGGESARSEVGEDGGPGVGSQPVQCGVRRARRADCLEYRDQIARAVPPFSNSLSSIPQSPQAWVTGIPAQVAQVSAAGPGGSTPPVLPTQARQLLPFHAGQPAVYARSRISPGLLDPFPDRGLGQVEALRDVVSGPGPRAGTDRRSRP
jgi:hypothetical protein